MWRSCFLRSCRRRCEAQDPGGGRDDQAARALRARAQSVIARRCMTPPAEPSGVRPGSMCVVEGEVLGARPQGLHLSEVPPRLG